MIKKPAYTILLTVWCSHFTAYAQNDSVNVATQNIRLNQLGFYPNTPKIAIVTKTEFADYQIIGLKDQKTVYEGKLVKSVNPALNGKETLIADFSLFNKPGQYVIAIKGLGNSFPFAIQAFVYHNLAVASVKAYYYQRASTALPVQYAGIWSRAAGHPDDQVLVHPSAATPKRPAGTIIYAARGWYDAGDYNKYMVNSGVTMGTMLALCEDFPDYIKKLHTNIPESNNEVPDVLDELTWNLRWMLTMQDPNDGGVYNKLTNANFDGMVMPQVTKAPRYVVQKGTAATLDFSAVTAQASRLLKKYSKSYPGLADSCINASKKAWEWARQYPDSVYNQAKMNTKFKPGVSTGGYGDNNYDDEFTWAASELYITTGNTSYYDVIKINTDERVSLPSWANVRMLAYYSLIRNESALSSAAKQDVQKLKLKIINLANDLKRNADTSAYLTVMGKNKRDFGWGSNSNAGNQGVALIQAYQISKDATYLKYALSNLDYLLGRNASGYSYVTGVGSKTPMHPHHRPSAADGVTNPIPGLLVGGPNPGEQDGVKLVSIIPDEAYIDDERSFATNEIAINWNAPLVYLVNAVEALQQKISVQQNKKQ
ncbi:glycoside hydrolase family 9 protein [Mucilaginibacter terrae]|uniref:glycoside hydrolase family 9 protein n=1 Tax=Mucilaginibacter terrae TaxID=1955052 RepID=UPI00366C692A